MNKTYNIFKIAGSEDFFAHLREGIINRIELEFNPKDVIILLPTKHAASTLAHQLKSSPTPPLKHLSIVESSISSFQQKLESTETKDDPFPTILKNDLNNNITISSINDLEGIVYKKSNKEILSKIDLIFKISEMISEMNLANFSSITHITNISENIANLIFKMELYNINIDELIKIIDFNLSFHQQEIFNIIKNILLKWRNSNYITKSGWNNSLIEQLPALLKSKIIILAGINTQIPSIVNAMRQISCHQNGRVIIYGTDENQFLDDSFIYTPPHPQFTISSLCEKLGVNLKDTPPFNKNKMDSAKFFWLTKSLSPPPIYIKDVDPNKIDFSSVKYFITPDLHSEAKVIIDLVEKNLDKTVMIVTADESLMVKIILNLEKRKILADVIRDIPLAKTQKTLWFKLCMDFICDNFSNKSLLAMIKGNSCIIKSELVNEIELALRTPPYSLETLQNSQVENSEFKFLFEQIDLLKVKISVSRMKFIDRLEAHLSFSQSLGTETEDQEYDNFIEILKSKTSSLWINNLNEYKQVIEFFLKNSFYRSEVLHHKISILKPTDALLHKADLVILCGLNDNIWPKVTPIDTNFNDKILTKIGFPSLEETLAEETLNFQCLSSAKELILTRSEKVNGTNTIASSWLLRILNIAQKYNWKIEQKYIDQQRIITENRLNITPPIPPLNIRPIQLSATQIDKLIFNPYHIYVDLILKLKPLQSFDKKLSNLDFGIFVHKSLELFHRNDGKNLDQLLLCGRKALAELKISFDKLDIIYWSRFERIAQCFIQNLNNNKAYIEASGILRISDKFMVTARADRIEISSDNKIHIIDYKTGRLPTQKAIYNGNSLQLLIEGVIASEGGFKFQRTKQEVASLIYINLTGGAEPIETLSIDQHKDEILSKTKYYIQSLITEYNNIATPYYYTQKKNLGYCEYSHLARIFN